MNQNKYDAHYAQPALSHMRENWYWYLLLGIALVVLGSLAIIFSYTTTLFSVIYLGGFLTVVGILEAVQSFKMRFLTRFFMHALLAVAYIVAGGYIVMHPEASALHLTLFIAAFFVISGLIRTYFAVTHQLPHKGLLIINGVATIILGALIWQQWPVSGLWAIGLFVGIDALFTGWNWIALSLYAKNLSVRSENS